MIGDDKQNNHVWVFVSPWRASLTAVLGRKIINKYTLFRSALTKNSTVRHLILFGQISCMAKSWEWNVETYVQTPKNLTCLQKQWSISVMFGETWHHRALLLVRIDFNCFDFYEGIHSTVVIIVLITLQITEINLYDECLENSFRSWLTELRDNQSISSNQYLGRSVWFSMQCMAVWLTERT